MLAQGGPSPQALDRALARVLARPEFATAPEPAWRQAVRRWLEWLGEKILDVLRRLFPHLPRPSEGPGVYRAVALSVLAALGLALLAYVALLVRRRARLRAQLQAAADQDRPLTAADWEARADAAGRAGLWREAAVALYQAVLHRLSERGRLRRDPAKTPGDYRREARRDPRLGPSLDGFLRSFEQLAYGRGRGDEHAFGRLRELAVALEAHD